jgi:hypothetical protein
MLPPAVFSAEPGGGRNHTDAPLAQKGTPVSVPSRPFRHGLVSMPSLLDLDQYGHFGTASRWSSTTRSFDHE